MTSPLSSFRALLAGGLSLTGIFAMAQGAIDFHRDIFPVLEGRCFKCHSSEKQKGDLRLDSPVWIEKGSENGPVLVPGNPDESPMYFMTTYPEDDPDYMPSKGEGLTLDEQDLLKRWILDGADFGADAVDSMMMVGSIHDGSKKKYTEELPLPPALYEMPAALAEVVVELEARGVLVDTVNHDATQLELTYTYVESLDDFSLKALDSVADSVVKLNFGRSQLADAQLKGISRFRQLRHLSLHRTTVSDAALEEIGKIETLEYLNLFQTQVTDTGLAKLVKLKDLKQIYLYDTAVTSAGLGKLQAALPDLKIIR